MPTMGGKPITHDQAMRIIDNRCLPGRAIPAPDLRPRAVRRAEAKRDRRLRDALERAKRRARA